MPEPVTSFHIDAAEADLADLRDRLQRTRWPEKATDDGWAQGVPLGYLRELCRYWADEYDWPARQRRLNALPQFRTVVDGLGIHFIHARSPRTDALPLVMTHGWPGSVAEFAKVIGPLTDPAAHGGDPADAFHVVCPSLPGFGFSDQPAEPGWGIERIADAWTSLMERLGYPRFAAEGGDWGTSVSTRIGQRSPEKVVGLHLVPPLAPPDPATFDDLTSREQSALKSLRRSALAESGYSAMHATRPQTVGYALTDSPAALAAWIVEKFWSWSDHDGDMEAVISRDELLDNLMLYWLPRTGASSARLYRESIRQVGMWISGPEVTDTVSVPVGCSVFPGELQRPSRRWAERRFTDIRYWSEPARGGHFAALEQPELFVEEVRDCFRTLPR
jgi:pimeloyl-ACP methyl ester carboxylesterase